MAVGVAVARLEAVEAVLAGKAAVFTIRPTGLHIRVTRKMQTLPQRRQQSRHLQNQELPRDGWGGVTRLRHRAETRRVSAPASGSPKQAALLGSHDSPSRLSSRCRNTRLPGRERCLEAAGDL